MRKIQNLQNLQNLQLCIYFKLLALPKAVADLRVIRPDELPLLHPASGSVAKVRIIYESDKEVRLFECGYFISSEVLSQ